MDKSNFIAEYKNNLHKRCTKEELELLDNLNKLSIKYFESKLTDLCYVNDMTEDELNYLYDNVNGDLFNVITRDEYKVYFFKEMRLGTVANNDKGQPVIQEQNNPFVPLISLLLEIKQDSNTNEIKKQSAENNNDKSEEVLYSDKDVKVKAIHPSDEEWKKLMANATTK